MTGCLHRSVLLGACFAVASAFVPPAAFGGLRLRAARTLGCRGLQANAAGGLFEPTYETHGVYREAADQMLVLHADKCNEQKIKELDEAFWRDLDARLQRIPAADETDLSNPESLWRFNHFLTMQKLIALPLTGRTRIDGVSRRSLGPLKDLDEGRRQVRAAAYYPGLSHQPFHDFKDFEWLRKLHADHGPIREELDRYLESPDNKWTGNNCQDFDKYGWTQISLNTFGQGHSEALKHFPETMALLEDVPYGPRDLCIVRQRARSGLPRHSDQRNYMLTAHIVLKTTPTSPGPAASGGSSVDQKGFGFAAKGKGGPASKKKTKTTGAGASQGGFGFGSKGKAAQATQKKQAVSAGLDEQSALAEAQAAALQQTFNCSLWCDGDEQEWRQDGAATVIDTTYWHQTWNACEDDVYVLLVDFWHPDLTSREVEALKAFTELEGIYLQEQGIEDGLESREIA